MVDEVADLTGRLTEVLTRANGLMDALGVRASSNPPPHGCGAAALQSARAGSEALAELAAAQADMLRESVQDLSGAADTLGLALQMQLIEVLVQAVPAAGVADPPAHEPGACLPPSPP